EALGHAWPHLIPRRVPPPLAGPPPQHRPRAAASRPKSQLWSEKVIIPLQDAESCQASNTNNAQGQTVTCKHSVGRETAGSQSVSTPPGPWNAAPNPSATQHSCKGYVVHIFRECIDFYACCICADPKT
ncbi:unnamed protein product, partial [Symbiodinium sp. CCMP2456]